VTATPQPCPLCGCDLECRGCYCHDDPEDKSYRAGIAAERDRIRQLAIDRDAMAYDDRPPEMSGRAPFARIPFADLLTGGDTP
jgi:hypothetical protein